MPAPSDTLFGYLARDSRPPTWRESAQTALQISGLGIMLLVLIWCERGISRAMAPFLVLFGVVYNISVAGRLTVSSASFSAYLTTHIQRFDLIRVSLLSDADLIRTLFHITFFHNRRSLAEALGGLMVVWLALAGSTYWQTEPAPRLADYLNNGLVAGIIVVGVCLLHPFAALLGIFGSLIGKRAELAVGVALLLFIAAIIGLLILFANASPFQSNYILPPMSAALTCLVPPGVLIGGCYAVVYGLLRRR